ncbi:hypothetical protein JCM10295v2_000904 [Rhodotorula toruloides]
MDVSQLTHTQDIEPHKASRARARAPDRLLAVFRTAIFVFLIKELEIQLLCVPRNEARYLAQGRLLITPGHGTSQPEVKPSLR